MKKQIEVKVRVPSKVEDIKLEQYQELMDYRELVKEVQVPKNELLMRLVSIFCRVDYKVVRTTMGLKDIQSIGTQVASVLAIIEGKGVAADVKFNPFVKIAKVNCGFITNFEGMSGGEFSDVSTYISDWKNMHKAMAVLYRPITKKRRNFLLGITQYSLADYTGTDKYAEAMKQMPAVTVLQTLVFIESSYQSCQSIIQTYTQNLLKKTLKRKGGRDMDLKKLLTTTGVGTKASMQ